MASQTLWTLCAAAAAVLSLAASTSPASADGVFRLLVLHISDMHSRYDVVTMHGGSCDRNPCYGGFARVKAAANRERRLAASDPAVAGSLFLNAGDTFQGSAFFSFFGWSLAAQMIERLNFDAVSFGNHEFDRGIADAESFAHNITAPVLFCNVDLSGEPSMANERNIMKSKVLTVKGRKIGIIGYLTPETALMGDVGNLKILPEIPEIRAEAKRLKSEGVNILIALGHSGINIDLEIAAQVEDIDLVVGGHTNTFLYTGRAPDIEIAKGQYPFVVEQPKTKRKVPVIHAFHITKYLGKLWIEFDDNGEVIKSYGNPILMDYKVEQDEELSKEVQKYKSQIVEKTNVMMGSTSVFLEGNDKYCRIRECNFGNLITDAYVNYNIRVNIKSFDLTKQWTDAPIAIIQSGGIRTNINSTFAQGVISVGDYLGALPFDNDIGKITTKGSDIWAAFEYSVKRYDGILFQGEFLQVSGLKAIIDLSRPPGKRVRSVEARCGDCLVPVYEKLDLNANYTVIISQYLSEGGDGHSFGQVKKYHSLGVTEYELMKEEIRIHTPMWSEIDGRIILLNQDKIGTGDASSAATSAQHFSEPFTSYFALLLAAVALNVMNRL